MKQRLLLWISLLLAVIALAVIVSGARAAPEYECDPFMPDGSINHACDCSEIPDEPTYCYSGMDFLAVKLINTVQVGFISLQKTSVTWYWFLARLVAGVAEMMMDGDFWSTVRDGLMTQLRTVMGGEGGVLAELIGGNAGFFYIAIMLAGVLMTFPLIGDLHLVKIERVISWGVVLIVLFVAGSAGFDLIDGIERLRVDMMRVIAGSDNYDSLIDLIALPMMATPDEARTIDAEEPWVLPGAYELTYFREINDSDYEPVRILLGEVGTTFLDFVVRGELLDDDTLTRRQEAAANGGVRVVVGVFSAYVMALFGAIFALLTAASLVLILFFVASLPLGFFEFGGDILMGIFKQYIAVVALSLFAGVMVRFMGGVVTTQILPTADLTPTGLPAFLAAMVIVMIALMFAVNRAWGILDGSVGIMQTTISHIGAASTSGPLGGAVAGAKGAVGSAVQVAAAVGAGAVTGGAAGALVAGAGSMLSGTQMGHTAASVATMAAPDSKEAQMFASAAYSRSAPNAAMGLVALSRRSDRRDASETGRQQANLDQGFEGGLQYESRRTNPAWGGAVDMNGQYLTPDLGALQQAESAYFQQGDSLAAHDALERTFGSSALANDVLEVYEKEGEKGASRVRQTVEITQATAQDVTERGYALYDEQGRLARPFEEAVSRSLQSAGLYGKDTQQSTLTGRLVGASVRVPVNVWEDPQAARKLAVDTQNPEASEVRVGDSSAQYRLHDLVQNMGWNEQQVEQLFAAYPQAQREAARHGVSPEEELYKTISQDPYLAVTSEDNLREAARLTTLVAADAQVQRPAEARLETMPPQAPPQQAQAGVQHAAPVGRAEPVELPAQEAPEPARAYPAPVEEAEPVELPTQEAPEPARAYPAPVEEAELAELPAQEAPEPVRAHPAPVERAEPAEFPTQEAPEPVSAHSAPVEEAEPAEAPAQKAPEEEAAIPLAPVSRPAAPAPVQPAPPPSQTFNAKVVLPPTPTKKKGA